MKKQGKIIGDAPCPSCNAMGRDRTGDHLILFEDGGAYCNRCGYTESPGSRNLKSNGRSEMVTRTPNINKPFNLDIIHSLPIKDIPVRHISKKTCERFGVRVALSEEDGTTITHIFYPRYKNGDYTIPCAYHMRELPKNFSYIGDSKGLELFGKHVQNTSSKTVYVTEGSDDAMALYEALVSNSTLESWCPTVVALTGAHNAKNALTNDFDYFNSFEKIVLVLDSDKAGRDSAKEAAQVFSTKTYIAALPMKDPNDMVIAGRSEELKWCVIKAAKYTPDNIINGKDTWEAYLKAKDTPSLPYPPFLSELNKKTYGVRYGSIVTVASGSGCGKTQLLRELKYHYFNTTSDRLADIALEEGLGDTVGGMLSIHLNKRITLPDVHSTLEEQKSAHEYMYGSGRWEMYDHFGGMDDETLFAKIRHLASDGVRIMFLDHLSIIVSEYASEGGERERIDTIMTKLAKMAKEFGIIIFLVVHLKKSSVQGGSFEEGTRPTLDDLRGSGSIKQLSWDVLFLTRNQQHPIPTCANTSLITVGKCRFTGRTGDADYVLFDESTGRLRKVERPMYWDVKELEEKNNNKARF